MIWIVLISGAAISAAVVLYASQDRFLDPPEPIEAIPTLTRIPLREPHWNYDLTDYVDATLAATGIEPTMTMDARTNFVGGDRHALYVGWVIGLAAQNGLKPDPVLDDEGNYTDRFTVEFKETWPGGIERVTFVVPPPPTDWTPDPTGRKTP